MRLVFCLFENGGEEGRGRLPNKNLFVMSLTSFTSAIIEAGKRKDREAIKQVLNEVKAGLVGLL